MAMRFPRLPGRFPLSYLPAAWALVALTGFCFAAESILQTPTLEPPVEKEPEKKGPANSYPKGGFPYSPLSFDEGMFQDCLDRQDDYLVKLGEVEQDPRGRNIHVFADGGFFMLDTYFSGPNPAFLVSGAPTKFIPAPKFNFNMNFAPVVNLGVINDAGWGVRGSWEQLDESTAVGRFPSNDASGKTTVSSVPVFGVPGFTAPGPLGKNFRIVNDRVNFSDHVRFTIFDAEVFKEFHFDPWTLLMGGGVRYLYLSQSYDAFRINTGTAKKTVGKTTTTLKLIEDSDRVDSGRNFGSAGPLGSLEVRYRVGRWPVWLYGTSNGAVLFGREETESLQCTKENLQTTVKTGSTSTATKLVSSQTLGGTTAADKTFTVADFEVGVSTAIPYGRFLLLLRAGVADEIIFNGGDATSAGGDIGFFGLRFTAGVNY